MTSEGQSYAGNKDTEAEYRRRATIRDLNDNLRRTMTGGRVMITNGIEALGLMKVTSILHGVRQFDDFSYANDPFDEHDFGALTWQGHRVFWKIDYYDKQLEFGSPDPADPGVTVRVITIMLASEY